MSNRIRAAVIGIGNMGSAHARFIHSGVIEGMRLTAVCDLLPERLVWAERELPGARRFSDFHSLIASGEVDAVIIAVPHPMHSLIAMEALRAGLHVLCEKPLDIRLSLAKKAVQAGKETGRITRNGRRRKRRPRTRASCGISRMRFCAASPCSPPRRTA